MEKIEREKKRRAAGAVFEIDCQYRLNKITGTIKTDPYVRSFQSATRETALISEHQSRNYCVSLGVAIAATDENERFFLQYAK